MTRMKGHTPSPAYLNSLTVEDASLSITVNEGDLPEFLQVANDAIRRDDQEQARVHLNDSNIAIVQNILLKDPGRTDLMFILGYLLEEIGSFGKACTWYQRLFALEPHAMIAQRLCVLFQKNRNCLSDAIAYGEHAVHLDPQNPVCLMLLGKCLITAGQRQRGRALLKKALRMKPDSYALWAAHLWFEHYFEDWGPAQFHQGYQTLSHIKRHHSFVYTTYENDPDPDRRLRVGLLSPNFFDCSAAVTLEPFLDGYNRDVLEVIGYGNLAKMDHVTDRMIAKLDRFTNIFGMPNDEVAHLIRADQIDVLVGVAGLCQHNRLGMMRYKAAPVQVDWGGLDTSGINEIRYRISDVVLDPPSRQQYYLEETVYLEGGMFCFRPIMKTPLVGPLPAIRNGFVTFGSFNNCKKISDTTLAMWVEVLQRIPNSRLFLKLANVHDELVRKTYLAMFTRCGIAPERIHLKGYMSHFDHLQVLGQVDLVLDTFPFNGFISTFDALWMGVPVLSLCGETWVACGGATLLTRVGLDVFVAHNRQEYVQKACAVAKQLDQLNTIRQSLRPLLLASPLCDCQRYARELEGAFRGMWRGWVNNRMKSEDGVAM